jgi:hypothetical protein
MRVLPALWLTTLLASSTAFAADGSDHASPLAGTWMLKSAYDLHKDGSKTFGFGSKPQGVLLIDAAGDYSLQVFRSNEATFAVDERGMRKDFKPSELASAHYGHVVLDPQAHTVTFRIEVSYIQRWNGTTQVRPYQLTDDELSYQVPPQPGSDSMAVSVWKRMNVASSSMRQSATAPQASMLRNATDPVSP